MDDRSNVGLVDAQAKSGGGDHKIKVAGRPAFDDLAASLCIGYRTREQRDALVPAFLRQAVVEPVGVLDPRCVDNGGSRRPVNQAIQGRVPLRKDRTDSVACAHGSRPRVPSRSRRAERIGRRELGSPRGERCAELDCACATRR